MADDSILTKTKKMLGITEDYEEFDIDVVTHINSVFARLFQLGIGPENGYMIEDKATQWVDYLGDALYLNNVKSYMYMRVRVLFDPPATSFALAAIQSQIDEEEFRLSLYAPPANYGDGSVTPPSPGWGSSEQPWVLTDGVWPSQAKTGDIGVDYVSGDVKVKG